MTCFPWKPYFRIFKKFSIWNNEHWQLFIPSKYTLIKVTEEMNTSITYDNVTLLELCPTYSNHERQLVTSLAFWLDGILKSVLAIFGLLFNLSASYVLYQPKMRNSFNKCLIAKSGIDSIFLMISIVECFRRRYVTLHFTCFKVQEKF